MSKEDALGLILIKLYKYLTVKAFISHTNIILYLMAILILILGFARIFPHLVTS